MSDRDTVRRICAGDDLASARQTLREFLAENSGAATSFAAREAMAMMARLELPDFRVLMLSSFTIDPLEPHLQISEFLAGRRLAFDSIPYEQWQGALGALGPIDDAAPDVIVMLLHLDDIAPLLVHRHLAVGAEDLARESERVIGAIAGALTAYRRRSAVPVILSTFIPASRGAERHFDRRVEPSRQGAIDALNARLADVAGTIPHVYVFDYAGLVSDIGRLNWFDRIKAHHVKASIASRALPILAREISSLFAALRGPRRKLLAVDLDNTIWGGIVGEDGPDGIAVSGDYPGNAYADFQAFLANLRASGVALAAVSKNNPEDVNEAFQAHPHMPLCWDDFSAHRIDWNDKSANLRSIAEEMNIGLDSMVFADDNPLECDLVRRYLPEVAVVHLVGSPSLFADQILTLGGFDALVLTDEDRHRAESYSAEKSRTNLASSTNIEDFLAELQLELTLRQPRDGEIERVVQLFGKTNQFNLTTKRYDVAAVAALRADPAACLKVALLHDRYGDYGLIGVVATIDGADGAREIDSFLMSCRALGRKVEDSLLADVEADARADGVSTLIGCYRATRKNAIVADFYPAHGFVATEREGKFEKNLRTTSPTPFHDNSLSVRQTPNS